MDSDATIGALRDALAVSPDNVPLREHLAATLLAAGHSSEAEAEFREALARGAGASARLGLAHAFFALGKLRESQVLAEGLAEDREPAAQLLLARILLNQGSRRRRGSATRAPSKSIPRFQTRSSQPRSPQARRHSSAYRSRRTPMRPRPRSSRSRRRGH